MGEILTIIAKGAVTETSWYLSQQSCQIFLMILCIKISRLEMIWYYLSYWVVQSALFKVGVPPGFSLLKRNNICRVAGMCWDRSMQSPDPTPQNHPITPNDKCSNFELSMSVALLIELNLIFSFISLMEIINRAQVQLQRVLNIYQPD